MNARTPPKGRPLGVGKSVAIEADEDCPTCGGWITRRCGICAGKPDAAVSIEEVVRGLNAIDRAARRREAA
jgi:hypothetical protein